MRIRGLERVPGWKAGTVSRVDLGFDSLLKSWGATLRYWGAIIRGLQGCSTHAPPSHNQFSEYWVNLWFGSVWVGLGFTQSTSYHFVGKMALSTDHLAMLRSV